MKKIQCEVCGTKYSLEDVRKMLVSGTVSVEGDVKTNGLENTTLKKGLLGAKCTRCGKKN